MSRSSALQPSTYVHAACHRYSVCKHCGLEHKQTPQAVAAPQRTWLWFVSRALTPMVDRQNAILLGYARSPSAPAAALLLPPPAAAAVLVIAGPVIRAVQLARRRLLRHLFVRPARAAPGHWDQLQPPDPPCSGHGTQKMRQACPASTCRALHAHCLLLCRGRCTKHAPGPKTICTACRYEQPQGLILYWLSRTLASGRRACAASPRPSPVARACRPSCTIQTPGNL